MTKGEKDHEGERKLIVLTHCQRCLVTVRFSPMLSSHTLYVVLWGMMGWAIKMHDNSKTKTIIKERKKERKND